MYFLEFRRGNACLVFKEFTEMRRIIKLQVEGHFFGAHSGIEQALSFHDNLLVNNSTGRIPGLGFYQFVQLFFRYVKQGCVVFYLFYFMETAVKQFSEFLVYFSIRGRLDGYKSRPRAQTMKTKQRQMMQHKFLF